MFDAGVVLADGEFSTLESAIIGAPLEMTNNYMKAVAYNEVWIQAVVEGGPFICACTSMDRFNGTLSTRKAVKNNGVAVHG